MPEVRADLILDVDEALSAVDQLGSSLESTLESATDSLSLEAIDVPVTADTTQAEAEISAIPDSVEDVDVPVSADATEAFATMEDFEAVAEGLDPQVPITADAAAAEGVLDDFAALAEATDPQIAIGVDSTEVDEAAGALDQLSGAADETSGSVEQAGGAAEGAGGQMAGLSAGVALAKGNLQGATTSVLGMSEATTAMAGKLGVVGAAIGLLVSGGAKMQAGIDRANLVFGDFAGIIESVNLGGLTGDMGDLAAQAGTSGAEIRQAAASVGQFAQAGGLSQEASARLVSDMEAIALRAVAMNPALGSAGDVMAMLMRAVQRGGPMLAKLGLNFNAVDIAAEAAKLGLIQVGDSLTPLDKLMAGVSLASQQLGDHIGTDFQKGTEQAAVSFKRLESTIKRVIAQAGQPLIAPLVAIGDMIGPILELGFAFTKLSGMTLLLGTGMKVLTSVMAAIQPILNTIVGAIDAVVAAFTEFVQGALDAGLSLLGDAINEVASGFEAFGSELLSIGGDIVGVFADIGNAIGDVVGFFFDLIGVDVGAFFDEVVSIVGDVIGALGDLGGMLEDVAGFLGFGEGLSVDMNQLKTASASALREIADGFAKAKGAGMIEASDAVSTLTDLFKESAPQARVFGAALVEAGVITRAEFNTAMGGAKEAVTATGAATEAAAAKVEAAKERFRSFAESVIGTLPTAMGVAEDVAGAFEKMGIALNQPIAITALNDALASAIESVVNFKANIAAVGDISPEVAKLFASLGPEVGGALAQGFLAADEETRNGTIMLLASMKDLPKGTKAILKDLFPDLFPEGKKSGESGGKGLAEGISSTAPESGKAAGKHATAAVAEGSRNTGQMAEAGRAIGRGFANGILETSGNAQIAGLQLVTSAAAGTRSTGQMAEAGAAGAQGYANGVAGAAGIALGAGLALVTAAAAGTRNTGLMAEGGVAGGQAYATSTQGQVGLAIAAGLALVTGAAAGTRNTGLMAEGGQAGAQGYANGVMNGVGAAIFAGAFLVANAAAATRGTGAFNDAGIAAANAYASGISHGSNAAVNAARDMAVRAVEAAKNAGSPTTHLWSDMAEDHAAAYGSSLTVGLGRVQSAMRVGVTGGVKSTSTTSNNVQVIVVRDFNEALGLLPGTVRSDPAFLEF